MKEPSIITVIRDIIKQMDKLFIPVKEFTIPCTLEDIRDLKWYFRQSSSCEIRAYADTELKKINMYGYTVHLKYSPTESEELALKAQEVLGIGDGETDSLIKEFDKILEWE